MTVSNNPNAIAMYMAGTVTQADPSQIIVLLYEGAIYRIGQAVQEMEKQNTLASGIALYRGLAIIGELRKSLNLEEGGEIARNLDRLYLHMHEELVKGHLAKQAQPLERVPYPVDRSQQLMEAGGRSSQDAHRRRDRRTASSRDAGGSLGISAGRQRAAAGPEGLKGVKWKVFIDLMI